MPTSQPWLSSRPSIDKPALPEPGFRGEPLIAALATIEDTTRYGATIDRWASSTWDAYAHLQELARSWIRDVIR